LNAKATQAAAQLALRNHLNGNPTCRTSPKSKNSCEASGFLPKLAMEQWSDTRRGLDLEELMAKELLRDSNKNKTVIDIIEIATSPLCSQMDLPIQSVNCSADFVAACHSAPGHTNTRACHC
jgi:hypothetical protein